MLNRDVAHSTVGQPGTITGRYDGLDAHEIAAVAPHDFVCCAGHSMIMDTFSDRRQRGFRAQPGEPAGLAHVGNFRL